MLKGRMLVWVSVFLYHSCIFGWVLNNPYPEEESRQKIYYSTFPESPKTLDPAVAYNVNESLFIEQVVESLLEYDYLKRPYELVPLLAQSMPEVSYYDHQGLRISDSGKQPINSSVYTIRIRPHILYQPHPAFAQNKQGEYRYLNLSNDYLSGHHIQSLSDFPHTGTRELIAEDFVYQMKRLASPRVNSPILGLMQDYIIGFKALNTILSKETTQDWLDLRNYPLEGVKVVDRYTFEIHIKGQYQPFLYWLAMHFFAPTPWEADKFYTQPGMKERNLGFAWSPVGTGPFKLTENNPNRRMVLEKNPNYRTVFFPSSGSLSDKKQGYLKHAGERLPLIDKAIYTLEKEAIPRWNKFLQGYYDLSAVSSDSYDQAIYLTHSGESELSPEMRARHIRLKESVEPSVFYMGFNMLDPLVGGHSERARLLRLAISLAINTEESIALFYNGRGEALHSPLPPGIFGYQSPNEAYNPYLYEKKGNRLRRRPLSQAKAWLKAAGYPGGIDPKTGKPLIIHYDVATTGGPDERTQLAWMRKRLAKIGLSLNVLSTQYNRFQEKMRTGNTQLFSWGWRADYPDPENFFFLLFSQNSKVRFGGENASNYHNPRFDALFNAMKNHKNDSERLKIIQKMIKILQYDAPWIWGFYGKTLTLSQSWITPIKPNAIMSNTLKFISVDVPLRNRMRTAWNQAILWPLCLILFLSILFLVPLLFVRRSQEKRAVSRF